MLVLKKNNPLSFSKRQLKSSIYIILLVCLSPCSYAKTITIKSAHIYSQNDTYYLDAAFNIKLTEEALKALKNGIALNIHTQFQLYLQRKWLWHKKINEITLRYRIEHRPLTNDYLIIDLKNRSHRFYKSLDTALNKISSFSKLYLFNKQYPHPERHYIARLRAFIDLSSLPPPIRPQAYFSNSWDISSEWHEWVFIP